MFALQGQQAAAGALAFWMANAAELLNFLQRDGDVSLLTRQSQLELSQLVHRAYRYVHAPPSRSQQAGCEATAFGFPQLSAAPSAPGAEGPPARLPARPGAAPLASSRQR